MFDTMVNIMVNTMVIPIPMIHTMFFTGYVRHPPGWLPTIRLASIPRLQATGLSRMDLKGNML